MDDFSINELIKNLWTKDSQNAIASIKAIGEIALPALFLALKKDDRNSEHAGYENGALLQAIIEIGEPAFEKLIEALAPGSNMVRAAAKTLKRWGDERAVDYMIIAMLNDDIDINSRCYIIEALGYFKDPKAFEPLKTALLHKDEYIRSNAARALAEYGDISAMPSIFDALKHVNRNWWHGTTESIGEIIKVTRNKCKEKGLEAEFLSCLNEMELRYPEMVNDYKEWVKDEPLLLRLDIPGIVTGTGKALIFFQPGTRPLLVKIKSNARFYMSAFNNGVVEKTVEPFEGVLQINDWCSDLHIETKESWSIEVEVVEK